jgi:hypothetical protein
MTRHRAGVRWRRGLSLLGLTLTVLGCPSAVSRQASTPETREILVAESTEQTWQQALQTLATMGAATHQQDLQSGSLQAIVHHAVLLQVRGQPVSPTITRRTVTGAILPNTVVLGTLTDVQDFLRRYQTL